MEGRIGTRREVYTIAGSERWILEPWTDEPALLTLAEQPDKTNIIQ